MIGEDQQVLEGRLRQRDERALAELYDATSRRAFGLAYRVLGDGAAADDVLQSAYTSACGSRQMTSTRRGAALRVSS